ncbi:DUF6531 domain-containing protein [Streptomyces sp. NPDC046853]|uniref:scabin-related ADP-ribosyltransferase n=1 Tax=Streptomyces sp. NPDC046853 TaxID=3154920 RepID=UPI0033E30E5A
MRVLVVVLVLSVVAGGGWLIRVSAQDTGGGGGEPSGRGPVPAALQKPVTPKERREQTKDRAKATKSRGLPTTRSKPATAAQLKLMKQNRRSMKAGGPKAPGRKAGSGVRPAAYTNAAAAPSYTSGALYQYTADPFGNTAAQQGGWLGALGNHIGAGVPGEPLQVSAAIWQSGGADDEVHPVKVTWHLDAYGCRLSQDDNKVFDFGQSVQAPTLNTDKEFPVVNASITLPTTECKYPVPRYFIYACTTVADDPTDTESCGSYNAFDILPVLPEGAACGSVCGDASGAVGTTVTRADPVSTATGAFTEAFTDAQVPAPGIPFTAGRVYSSDNTSTGALGKGWQLPWETRLKTEEDGDVVLTGEGGARTTYSKASGGAFTTPGQARSTLAADGSGYKLTTADHRTYAFNASGQLTSLKDRTGKGLALAYTGGKPTQITDAAGRKAVLSYTADLLDKVTLADGRFVDYDYTGGQLTGVKALDGAIERYGWEGGLLKTVTDARQKVVTVNEYDSQGRVSSQTDAQKYTTSFKYSKNGQFDQVDVTAPDGGVWTDIYYKNVLFTQLDPLGNKSYYRYDAHFNRTSAVDAEVRETEWDFDTAGRMKRRASDASSESWTYDSNGNVATHTGGEYDKTVFGYTDDLLTSVTAPLGQKTIYEYNAATKLLEKATAQGSKPASYGYDGDGNLTSVITPEGNKTTYTYDSSGRMESAVDPRGNAAGADPAKYTTRFTYYPSDRLKSVTDARTNTTAYEYDPAGNLHKITDAKKRDTLYEHDDAGRLIKVTDPTGKNTRTGYDKVGRVNSVTDRTDGITTWLYDKAGRQQQMVTARGNATGADPLKYTWKYGYDKVGNRTTVTDPAKNTSAFTWDADDRPLSITDPLLHTRSVTYDNNGNILTTRDALGHGTTLTWDDNNRLATSKPWSGKTTSYEYDDANNLTARVTPEQERTTYGYDDDGRRTSMVDPRGNIAGADPLKHTWTFGYDQAGQPTSVTDPLKNTNKTGYDAVGNIDTVTDARQKQTVYEYDELNRPKKVTAPDNGTTDLTYNPAGFLDTSTDANLRTTTYGYDAEGRLKSVKNPLSRTVGYDYDPEGNRTKVTNARGQTITTTVDARQLPTKVTYSDGTPSQSYAYDAAGRIHEATDATGKRTVTYDDDDKIQTITSPGAAKPFTYAWNTNDTLKSRTYPDGRATSYGYDGVGRITSQTTDSKATGYAYDKAGNLTSVTLPTTTARAETRTYDEAGRLATLTTPTGSNTFGYDANSRLSTDTPKGAKPTRYGYDDVGRMTRACTDTTTESCLPGKTGGTYTYDKVGNLKTSQTSSTTTNYTYDEADQLKSTTAGTTSTSYGYDADGNQTNDGADTYTYDPLGRVKTATIGADAYTFGYDADGNRTVANKNNALIRTSRWDINNALPQIATDTNSSGALLGDYHFDPDGTARSMDRTNGSFYFTQDRQNSVSTVFDAKGTDNYRYTYSAWGTSTGKATISGGQSSIYGYTGQYKDQYLTGRLLLRDRSYDPDQRRFTTQDPIPAALDNPNKSPYNYAENDPANLSDPSGNCPMCIGAGIGGLLGGGIYALTHRDDFDWGDFAGATAKGAVIGAGAGFLAPAGAGLATSLGLSGGRALATAAVTDAAIGMGYTYAVNTVQCQPTSPADLLLGAAGGALGSVIPGLGALKAPKVNPFSNIDVDPRAIVNLRRVFRGDDRHPSVVFPEGFKTKGTNTDIHDYGRNNTPSAWVGTSDRESLGAMFPQHAKGKTWVYEINNPGPGIRVNKVLPWSYVFRAEREVIYPNGIDPSMIVRARRWEWGMPTGEVIENSGRRPNG